MVSFCCLTKGITPKICRLCLCHNKSAFFWIFYVFGSCFRCQQSFLFQIFCFLEQLMCCSCHFSILTLHLYVFQWYEWLWCLLTSLNCYMSTLHLIHYALLLTPAYKQCKRKTHGFRTFSCFGPHIWNSPPQDHGHCSTLSSFKAKLKTFFSLYFHPN